MSLRDTSIRALHDATGQADLLEAVVGMYEAIVECGVEGIEDPSRDPAVMLFGAHVSFLTHFDVNTAQGYSTLLERCAVREKYQETLQ